MNKSAKPGQDLKEKSISEVYPKMANKKPLRLRYLMAIGKTEYKTKTRGGSY